jgi:hypothetical protein
MRYRLGIWLLRPLLWGERWRCCGSLEATDESTEAGARSGGYWQGRMAVIDDLLERKTLPWMSAAAPSEGDSK